MSQCKLQVDGLYPGRVKYRAAYAANDIGHLEVDNENDDLGDGSLQTEEVGVLVFQGLIHQKMISMWTNLRLIHSSIC